MATSKQCSGDAATGMVWVADSAMGGILLHLRFRRGNVVRWATGPAARRWFGHDARAESTVSRRPEPIETEAEHGDQDREGDWVESVLVRSLREADGGRADPDDALRDQRSEEQPLGIGRSGLTGEHIQVGDADLVGAA